MKRYLALFVIVLFSATSQAQEWNAELFDKSLEVTSIKNKKEPRKGQIVRNKVDGIGIMRKRDKSLYIGDFVAGKITGLGMMISPQGVNIDNCDKCSVYIGYWRDGEKVGKGACYAENGDLIYLGPFNDNAPAGDYPALDAPQDRYFTMLDNERGDKFLGEISNGLLNGFGVMISKEGDLLITGFTGGKPSGIALKLTYDDQWQTFNFKNGKCTPITSSSRYENVSKAHSNAQKQLWSNVLDEFMDLTAAGISLASDIRTLNEGGNSSDYAVAQVDGTDSFSEGSKSTKSTSNANSDEESDAENKTAARSAAWRSDSRVYSNWESRIINMRAYPEKYDNYDADYKEAQTKMRQIRLKWEKRGYLITKSKYE